MDEQEKGVQALMESFLGSCQKNGIEVRSRQIVALAAYTFGVIVGIGLRFERHLREDHGQEF